MHSGSHFFQGGVPQSDAYVWFSFLDTPSNSLRNDDHDTVECEFMVGWPCMKGFMAIEEPLDVPREGKRDWR